MTDITVTLNDNADVTVTGPAVPGVDDVQVIARLADLSGVQGPATSTVNAIARWDSTNGQLLKNSGVIIDDSNNLVTAGVIAAGEFIGPRISGGQGAASTLTLRSTSGAGTTDAILFQTGSQVERMRIDSAGVITNGGAAVNTLYDFIPNVQFNGGDAGLAISFHTYSSANGPSLYFARSRNTTVGSHTAVQNGDVLGFIPFAGSDGTNFEEAAFLQCNVDGAVAANSVPGRLQFYTTPAGSQFGTERLRIDNAGRVIIGGAGATNIVDELGTPHAPHFQYFGSSDPSSMASIVRWSNDAGGSRLVLGKSRGAPYATTVVSSGDTIGTIVASATDGTDFAPAAAIAFLVDGTPGNNDMPGRIVFSTTADGANAVTERLRITSAGKVVIGAGHAAQLLSGFTPPLQVLGFTSSDTRIAIGRWSADTGAGTLFFAKSRGATVGSMTAAAAGDLLGIVRFAGTDGDEHNISVDIRTEVDAAVSNNIVPGRLMLFTADTSGTLAERLRINNGGFSAFTVNNDFTGFPATYDVPSGTTTPALQVFGSGPESSISVTRYSTGNPPRIVLARSNNAAIGSNTNAVTSGQVLGELCWNGSDTVAFDLGCAILGVASETWTSTINGARLEFYTTPNGSTTTGRVMTLTDSGHMLLSADAGMAGIASIAQRLQIKSSNAEFQIGLFNGGANNGSAQAIAFAKTRNSDTGSPATIVANNDALARILAYGADGSNFIQGGYAQFLVDGTPGLNDMPTRFEIATTADGASSPTLRVTVGQDGAMYLGTSAGFFSNDAGVFLRTNGDVNHGLIYNAAVNGPEYRGWQGHRWVTMDGGSSIKMVLSTTLLNFQNLTNYVFNHTAAVASVDPANAAVTPMWQVHGTTAATSAMMLGRWDNNDSPPRLTFAKSKNGTIGSHTVVSAGTLLGSILAVGSDGTNFAPAVELQFLCNSTPGGDDMPGSLQFAFSPDGSASVAARYTMDHASFSPLVDDAVNLSISNSLRWKHVWFSGNVLASGATTGIGYTTGAGGTVTQITSKSTGVTLNKINGQITMNGAALAADTTVSFTLTNSAIAATDHLILHHQATGTVGAYNFDYQCGAGSAVINVRNVTAGSLSEAIVIGFAVIKGVTA